MSLLGNHPSKDCDSSHQVDTQLWPDMSREIWEGEHRMLLGLPEFPRWLNYCSREHMHGVGLESMYPGNFWRVTFRKAQEGEMSCWQTRQDSGRYSPGLRYWPGRTTLPRRIHPPRKAAKRGDQICVNSHVSGRLGSNCRGLTGRTPQDRNI